MDTASPTGGHIHIPIRHIRREFSETMMSISKLLLAKLLLLTVSVIFSLGVVEAGFRIYGYVNGIDFRLYSKELKSTTRHPEGLFDNYAASRGKEFLATTSDYSVIYSISTKGMRDKEYSYQKPPGIVRFAVFGDSFTFGEGIPYGKRFTDIPEERIDGIEILNFGFPGSGIDTMVSEVFNEGLKYDPDYIVFMLNRYVTQRGSPDFSELLHYSASTSAQANTTFMDTVDTLYLKRDDPFLQYKPGFMLRNSYAASYLHYLWTVYTLKEQMENDDKAFWDGYKACEMTSGCDTVKGTDLTERMILLMNRLTEVCDETGRTLVAINIDSEPLRHFYTSEPPFRYFDLSDIVQEYSKTNRLSFKYDHHYNEQTNAFLGDELTKIIHELTDVQ